MASDQYHFCSSDLGLFAAAEDDAVAEVAAVDVVVEVSDNIGDAAAVSAALLMVGRDPSSSSSQDTVWDVP